MGLRASWGSQATGDEFMQIPVAFTECSLVSNDHLLPDDPKIVYPEVIECQKGSVVRAVGDAFKAPYVRVHGDVPIAFGNGIILASENFHFDPEQPLKTILSPNPSSTEGDATLNKDAFLVQGRFDSFDEDSASAKGFATVYTKFWKQAQVTNSAYSYDLQAMLDQDDAVSLGSLMSDSTYRGDAYIFDKSVTKIDEARNVPKRWVVGSVKRFAKTVKKEKFPRPSKFTSFWHGMNLNTLHTLASAHGKVLGSVGVLCLAGASFWATKTKITPIGAIYTNTDDLNNGIKAFGKIKPGRKKNTDVKDGIEIFNPSITDYDVDTFHKRIKKWIDKRVDDNKNERGDQIAKTKSFKELVANFNKHCMCDPEQMYGELLEGKHKTFDEKFCYRILALLGNYHMSKGFESRWTRLLSKVHHPKNHLKDFFIEMPPKNGKRHNTYEIKDLHGYNNVKKDYDAVCSDGCAEGMSRIFFQSVCENLKYHLDTFAIRNGLTF